MDKKIFELNPSSWQTNLYHLSVATEVFRKSERLEIAYVSTFSPDFDPGGTGATVPFPKIRIMCSQLKNYLQNAKTTHCRHTCVCVCLYFRYIRIAKGILLGNKNVITVNGKDGGKRATYWVN